jgi:S1-C subfamily serine protease
MLRKCFSASLLATAIFSAAFTAYAGQAMNESTNSHMPHYMAHAGYMNHGSQTDARPRLGIVIAAIPQVDLEAMSIEYGVQIMDVLEGSLAEDIGLKAGDVITNIDDRPVYSPQRLQYLVAEASGASTITLIRDGESQQLQAEYSMVEPAATDDKAALGIRVQELTEDLKEAFGADGSQGVLVSQVITGSAASEAGLKAGDVVIAIADKSITSVNDVHGALNNYKPGDTLNVSVLRNRQKESFQIVLGTAASSNLVPPYGTKGYLYPNHHFHGSHGTMSKKGCGLEPNQKRS